MIYSVCALFIDEVYFHDTTNSNGIIIDRVPPRKKVSATRKCFYCDRLGKCFNLDYNGSYLWVDSIFSLRSIKILRVLGRITDNNNAIYFNAKNN